MAGFFNISGDILKVARQGLELRSATQQANAGSRASNVEATLMLDNAKARYATGSQQAGLLAKEGRIAQSDAVAAMGGMGMATDPVLLAKLKSKSDLNSMRALFEAQSNLSASTIHAQQVRVDAATSKADQLKQARNNAYYNLARSGVSFAKFMSSKPKKGVSRPSGYDYSNVQTQGTAQGRGGY